MASIIHISDIHIRAGDKSKSRYDEYISVFDRLFQSIRKIQTVNPKLVIVITGDLFHNKNRLEPCGLKIALHLLHGLSEIATVYVIRGNHDYRQDLPEEDDIISALTAYSISGVHYLDKSGRYEIGDIGFGLVPIQDTLLYGAGCGVSSVLPAFPDPAGFSERVRHKVALFHGSVMRAKLQNGTDVSETMNGYPIEWFNGYDCVLLGDIHLQQVHRATVIKEGANTPQTDNCVLGRYTFSGGDDGAGPFAYPGSLIQQDFGEALLGHGFLFWNLEAKEVTEYHVPSDYGFCTLYRGNDGEIHILHRKGGKSRWVLLSSIVGLSWFPQKLRVRVSGAGGPDGVRLISDGLIGYGKQIVQISEMYMTSSGSESQTMIAGIEQESENFRDIQRLTSPESWVQYIQTNSSDKIESVCGTVWKDWLLHPESVCVPIDKIPEKAVTIREKIVLRNQKLIKITETLQSEIDRAMSGNLQSGCLSLKYIEWDWLLNYKDGNHFDFELGDSKICVFNAKNGDGKSNFLEIVCLALFGVGFPSRHNTSYASSIICEKKPVGKHAGTVIVFSLNDRQYCLKRRLERRTNLNARNIHYSSIVLTEYPGGAIVHQGKSAVDRWIDDNIGDNETFLTTAMLSQSADCDFFSLPKKDQKRLLDRTLSLNPVIVVEELLKEAGNAHRFSCDLLESFAVAGAGAGGGRGRSTDVVEAQERLSAMRTELAEVCTRRLELNEQWNHIPEKSFRESDRVLEDRLMVLEKYIRENGGANGTTKGGGDISTLREKLYALKVRRTEVMKFKTRHTGGCGDSGDNVLPDMSLSEIDKKRDEIMELTSICGPGLEMLDENVDGYQSLCLSTKKDVVKLRSDIDRNHDRVKRWCGVFGSVANFPKRCDMSELTDSIAKDEDARTVAINRLCELECGRKSVKECVVQTEDAVRRCLFERPNRNIWTDEQIDTVSREIVEGGGVGIEKLKSVLEVIRGYGKQLPVLAGTRADIDKEISRMSEVLENNKKIPFNPACGACKKQPWKILNGQLEVSLPLLSGKREVVCGQIDVIVQDVGRLWVERRLEGGEVSDMEKIGRLTSEYLSMIDRYTVFDREIAQRTKCSEWGVLFAEVSGKSEMARKKEMAMTEEYDALILDVGIYENGLVESRKKLVGVGGYCGEVDEFGDPLSVCDGLLGQLERCRLANAKWGGIYGRALKSRCLSEISQINAEYEETEKCIGRCEEIASKSAEVESVRDILKARPHWVSWKDYVRREVELGKGIAELEDSIMKCVEGGQIEGVVMEVRKRALALDELSKCFGGFYGWLYKEKLAPMIRDTVGDVLRLICQDRALALEAEWLGTIDTLSWFLRDGGSRCIIEKASGFQKFIVGIAMRVALCKMGICKVRFRQLFVDEGFTTCDTDNLDRVPGFLRGLLKSYDAVYLATHMEELKGCATMSVKICRDAGGSWMGVGVKRKAYL